MCQSAYKRIYPDKKYVMKYTTVGGVEGFDGTKKEAPKAVVKAIQLNYLILRVMSDINIKITDRDGVMHEDT